MYDDGLAPVAVPSDVDPALFARDPTREPTIAGRRAASGGLFVCVKALAVDPRGAPRAYALDDPAIDSVPLPPWLYDATLSAPPLLPVDTPSTWRYA